MALNAELIKQQAILATLTDDQINVLKTLSENDENKVIGTKIGELHGQYDTDVLTTSGIAKNQGEKTYDYNKRVISELKAKAAKAEELTTKISDLDTKIKDYEQQFKDGKGSEALAQKLKDAEAKSLQLENQLATEKTNWEKKEGEFTSQISSVKIDTEFEKATSGLKFKVGFEDDVQSVLISNAKQTILSKYKPDFIDDNKGGRMLVFRDEKDEILLNHENAMKPFTANELIQIQLKTVLDPGKQQPGVGTKTPKPGGELTEDFSTARTKVEFDEMTKQYLLKKGILKGSGEFADSQLKFRADFAGYNQLP